MATALVGNDEFNCEFEKWLLEKLKSYNSDVDESLVTYISSIVCDEDSEIEEKIESIAPILEELNQVFIFHTSGTGHRGKKYQILTDFSNNFLKFFSHQPPNRV